MARAGEAPRAHEVRKNRFECKILASTLSSRFFVQLDTRQAYYGSATPQFLVLSKLHDTNH